jgi:hypothetical protein
VTVQPFATQARCWEDPDRRTEEIRDRIEDRHLARASQVRALCGGDADFSIRAGLDRPARL